MKKSIQILSYIFELIFVGIMIYGFATITVHRYDNSWIESLGMIICGGFLLIYIRLTGIQIALDRK